MRRISVSVPEGVQYRGIVNYFLSGYRAQTAGWTREEETVDGAEVVLTAPDIQLSPTAVLLGTYDTSSGTVTAAPGVNENIEGDFAICLHCGTKRARQHLIVKDTDTGELFAIGKTACAKKRWNLREDFYAARLEDPQTVADQRAAAIDASPHIPTVDAIAAALLAVSRDGYTSKAKSIVTGSLPTSTVMESVLTVSPDDLNDHLLYAEMLRLWMLEDLEVDNDFTRDLRDIAALDHIPMSLLGLVAAMPTTQSRQVNAVAAREAGFDTSEPYADRYFGEIGKRETINSVLVVKARLLPTGSTLVEMKTQEGCKLTWFASPGTLLPPEGDIVDVKATVKKHEEFRGVYGTIINRCVLL